jgi:hypothetical protein
VLVEPSPISGDFFTDYWIPSDAEMFFSDMLGKFAIPGLDEPKEEALASVALNHAGNIGIFERYFSLYENKRELELVANVRGRDVSDEAVFSLFGSYYDDAPVSPFTCAQPYSLRATLKITDDGRFVLSDFRNHAEYFSRTSNADNVFTYGVNLRLEGFEKEEVKEAVKEFDRSPRHRYMRNVVYRRGLYWEGKTV